MKRRRLIIGAILFVTAAAVYLVYSGAPLRVHVVTLSTEFALAVIATYFFSAASMAGRQRLVGMLAGLTIVSLATTWLSSKVITAFTPLDRWYFATGLAATFLKAALLVGVIGLVDFAIGVLGRRRGNRSLAVVVVPLVLLSAAHCVTVAAVVEEPQVISRGELTYPPELRQRSPEGLVKLEMIVGADGTPRDIRIARDDPNAPPIDVALENFAIETVKQWKFKPATANGKAIERRYVTAIHWKTKG